MLINLIVTGASYIFPGGRTLKLVKNGINITNSTNLLTLTTNVTLAILDCYTPPPVRLTAYCLAAGLLLVATALYPNSIMIGLTINVVREIYNKC